MSLALHNSDKEDVNKWLSKSSGWKGALGDSLAGFGQGLFWDQVYHPDDSIKESLQGMAGMGGDKTRMLMALFNTGVGAAAGNRIRTGLAKPAPGVDYEKALKEAESARNWGVGLAMSIPAKDTLMAGGSLAVDLKKKLPGLAESANKPAVSSSPEFSTRDKLIAAALGAGALGLGAYGVSRIGKGLESQSNASNSGRVTLTLPTKDPNDIETQVSIPLNDAGVSAKTYSQLGRDVRRRLRGESTERKKRYIEAIESGIDPEAASLLKVSAEVANPSLLSSSHIKSISEKHAPPVEEPVEEVKDDKPEIEMKKLIKEQDSRIKELEKFVGNANGNKLGKVKENIRNIKFKKVAFAPTIGVAQGSYDKLNQEGGVQGVQAFKPMLFGPKFQSFKNFLQPFAAASGSPILNKLFGDFRPSQSAIVDPTVSI